MPSNSTIEKAIEYLDGVSQIAKAEMLVAGSYVIPNVKPERKDAICGGNKACLLGSLWISAGVRPHLEKSPPVWGNDPHVPFGTLPGVEEGERKDFLRHRPALKLAYNALNEAALKIDPSLGLAREGDVPEAEWESPAEELFEERGLEKKEILTLVNSAKRSLRKQLT